MTLQERSPHGKCRIVNNMSEETNKKEPNIRKKKPKYPLAILVVLPAVAICLSCVAAGASFLVNQKLNDIDKITQQLNSTTIPGVTTGETAAEESIDATAIANMVLHDDVKMNIIVDSEGNLAISSDSDIVLKNGDASVAIPVSAFVGEGDSAIVEYSSDQSTATIDGYSIKVSNNPFNSDDAVKLSGSEKDVYTSSKAFDDSCGLTIAYEVDQGTEYDSEQLHDIMSSAKQFDGNVTVTLFGIAINENWADNFAFNQDVAEFDSEDSYVYLSRYDGSLTGADLEDTITLADGLEARCGDIKDDETGLSPYFITSGDYTFKFLTTSSDILTSMFSANE